MKKSICLLLVTVFIIISGIGDTASAARHPDIISYDAELLQGSITVHIKWQSEYPVIAALVSAGKAQEEMELDPYDDNTKDAYGYHGEASLLLKVDTSGFTDEAITYVVQLIDDVGKRSRRISGTLKTATASATTDQTDNSLSDQYVTPSSGKKSPGMIDKVIKVMERHDTPPVVSEIRVNFIGDKRVNFFSSAIDDKGLKEVRIKILNDKGSLVGEKVFSGLGKIWQGTTESFKLDPGDYTVVAQAIDNTGNRSPEKQKVFSIKTGMIPDRTPPVTVIAPAGGTYKTAQSLTLTCTDTGGSGCKSTYYTTNGTAPTTNSPAYSGPVTVSNTTTIKFFSTDNAGNSEAVKTAAYTIEHILPPPPPPVPQDVIPPVTVATPAGGTYATAQTVTLTCSDYDSGCKHTYYTTDGMAPTTKSPLYRGPFTVSKTTPVQFFSTDAAGNSETAKKENYIIQPPPPPPPPKPPIEIPEGKCQIKITDDIKGHHGPRGAFFKATVKLLVPDQYSQIVITSDAAGTAPWGADDWANFTITSPTGAKQTASLGKNDAWGKPIGEQYILSNVIKLTPGMNTIDVELWNEFAPAGSNQGSSAMWLVVQCPAGQSCQNGLCVPTVPPPPPKDTITPVTVATPAGGTYKTAQNLTLTCTDAGSDCKDTHYTTDGTAPTTNSPAYSGPVIVSNTTIVKFFSTDNAGNSEAVKTSAYTIEPLPPPPPPPPVEKIVLHEVILHGDDLTVLYSMNLDDCAELQKENGNPADQYMTFCKKGDKASESKYSSKIVVGTKVKLCSKKDPKICSNTVTVTGTPRKLILHKAWLDRENKLHMIYTKNFRTGAHLKYTNYGAVTTDGGDNGRFPSGESLESIVSPQAHTAKAGNTIMLCHGNGGPLEAGNVGYCSTPVVVTQEAPSDTIPPVTAATPAGGTYATTQTVTLTCTDAGSGCKETYYKTDGTVPTTNSPAYSGPVTVSKTTTVQFFSVDKADNKEAVKTEKYVIQTPPPPPKPPDQGKDTRSPVVRIVNLPSTPADYYKWSTAKQCQYFREKYAKFPWYFTAQDDTGLDRYEIYNSRKIVKKGTIGGNKTSEQTIDFTCPDMIRIVVYDVTGKEGYAATMISINK